MQLDSRVIRLLKQEDFCGAITLAYFVENCRYLRKEDISKVLEISFAKVNQCTCDKRFVTKTYSDGYISLKDLYKFSLIYKHKYAYLKSKKSEK